MFGAREALLTMFISLLAAFWRPRKQLLIPVINWDVALSMFMKDLAGLGPCFVMFLCDSTGDDVDESMQLLNPGTRIPTCVGIPYPGYLQDTRHRPRQLPKLMLT